MTPEVFRILAWIATLAVLLVGTYHFGKVIGWIEGAKYGYGKGAYDVKMSHVGCGCCVLYPRSSGGHDIGQSG